jgi:putative phosphoribosyl transferase
VFVVRKLGWPGHQEFAMGAIASGGVRVLNPDLEDVLDKRRAMVDAVAERELVELTRRERVYRAGRAPIRFAGRCVVLVDDGLATGSSMLAAVAALRHHEPARVAVAVPVASADACARLRAVADDVVCAVTPEPFQAVGCWYDDFEQTEDDEVEELLARAHTSSERGMPLRAQ